MSKVYNTGNHSWKHGRVVDWHGNGAASRWLLGPCPRCGSVTSNYGLAYSCHNDHCANNANNFACGPDATPKWWDTDIDVKLDGDAWCATGGGFSNLQESPAGFGNTPQAAVDALIIELERIQAGALKEAETNGQ